MFKNLFASKRIVMDANQVHYVNELFKAVKERNFKNHYNKYQNKNECMNLSRNINNLIETCYDLKINRNIINDIVSINHYYNVYLTDILTSYNVLCNI